ALEKCDLVKHHLDVFALLLEQPAALFELGQKLLELALLVARQVVKIEKFAYFCEGKAQALATQRQLQANPVALAEQPVLALATGRQQAFILVMTDCA